MVANRGNYGIDLAYGVFTHIEKNKTSFKKYFLKNVIKVISDSIKFRDNYEWNGCKQSAYIGIMEKRVQIIKHKRERYR